MNVRDALFTNCSVAKCNNDGFGDPASDREAEPGPVGLPAGRVAAIEALEHVRQLLGGDANAGVAHDDRGPAVLRRYVQPNATARRRELDGVVEHNQEQLAYQRRIGEDLRLLECADLDHYAFVLS